MARGMPKGERLGRRFFSYFSFAEERKVHKKKNPRGAERRKEKILFIFFQSRHKRKIAEERKVHKKKNPRGAERRKMIFICLNFLETKPKQKGSARRHCLLLLI